MQENINPTVLLIIVFTAASLTMGIFVFVLFFRYNKSLRIKQKEALNNLIKGQENERERLARDLHDEMGGELAAIIYKLDQIKSSDEKVTEVKQEAKQKLKDAANKIRQIAHDLLPSTLSHYSLSDSLQELVVEYSLKPITIEFKSNCTSFKPNKKTELHLYRIIKELIRNTEKHSGANHIKIEFRCDSTTKIFRLLYTDNGKGLGTNLLASGIGLKNIKTRVNLMNGYLQIEGTSGFNLSLSLNAIDYE